ncbi:MAG: anti-sigma factor, partial [Acidobacteria bacterium]|nr:anti-sigma factor [Acidobacteriota bacterium]
AAEARQLDEHLETCAECRAELDSWRETTAALAYAAEAAEPSQELRGRILEKARRLPQLPQAAAASAPRPLETVTNGAAEAASNVIPLNVRPRRSWSAMQTLGAIAASLIIAALAVAFAVLWQRNSRLEAELAQAREDQRILTSTDASVALLGGTENASGARARLAYEKSTGRAILIADGLPPAPEGKAYQLWYINEGQPPMPGGVFTTDAAGHAEMREQIPPAGRGAGVFAVTLERSGGVPKPEGKAFLQGKASS